MDRAAADVFLRICGIANGMTDFPETVKNFRIFFGQN